MFNRTTLLHFMVWIWPCSDLVLQSLSKCHGLTKSCRYQFKHSKVAEEPQLNYQRDKLKWELFFWVAPALAERESILARVCLSAFHKMKENSFIDEMKWSQPHGKAVQLLCAIICPQK